MKKVMTRAWEIAKEAVVKFGGKSVEYLSGALKQAWKEVKEMKLVELKGSEKQVAWAEDIREGYVTLVKRFNEVKDVKFSKEEITQANARTAMKSLLGIEKKEKELYRERRFESREITKGLDKKERRAINAELREEYAEKLEKFVNEKIQDTLAQAEASFWIDRYKHLAGYGK